MLARARRQLRLVLCTSVACAALAVPAAAHAAITWDGGGGDYNWTTAANWTGDVVPSGDQAIIPEKDPTNPGSDLYVTVDVVGMQFVSSLVLRGVLFVSDTTTLDLAGSITIDGGMLRLQGGSAQVTGDTLDVTGTGIFSDGGYISGSGLVYVSSATIGQYGFLEPDPGTAPTLIFGSDLRFKQGGAFRFLTASPSSYGRFRANSISENEGEIVVVPNGYTPAGGDEFADVVNPGGGPVDEFASIDSRQVSDGRYLTQTQSANGLTLGAIQSTITVSDGGYPGGSVTVTGSSFVPGEQFTIDIFSADSGAQVSGTATASGAISVVVPISTEFKPGAITVDAYGAKSSTQTRTTGTLVAVPPCPTGQVGTSPNCTTPPKPPSPPTPPTPQCGVAATDGADRFIGCDGTDRFNGGSGADFFNGRGGSDHFNGGNSHDIGFGGVGNDVLAGDFGNDLVSGGVGDDHVFGGRGNDRAFGGPGNDLVSGGPGDDTIRGNAGNDRVYCSTGDDRASGNDGDDFIGCSDGRGGDRILGGSGDDTCVGDPGDVFTGCERIIMRRIRA